MKYWIKNGSLLLREKNKYTICKQDLLIENDKIKSIGMVNLDSSENYIIFDAQNQLIMPGLINSHTHAYMNFMKNSADDVPFDKWLFHRIIPVESKIESTDFYWCTLLGCIEMLKTGTTSYIDMHISNGESAKSARESGMRAFVGKCIRGEDLYGDANSLFKKAMDEKGKYENSLVKFVLSPHSVYGCSEKLLKQISNESDKCKMLKHIHLSESDKEVQDCLLQHKKTPVEYLHNIGFLDDKTLAAHCVKITDRDVDILSSDKVNVITNPSSNAKLGNGVAPVVKMLHSGINVCLGTDSAASNNTLNMFREMNILSLIHKGVNNNPTVLDANAVLKCVSESPAKALGLSEQLGTIREGAYADLIFLDLNSTSLFPNNNISSSLCYSANGSEVKSVMINGRFVMKDYEVLSIDTERVYYEINKIVNKYFNGSDFNDRNNFGRR